MLGGRTDDNFLARYLQPKRFSKLSLLCLGTKTLGCCVTQNVSGAILRATGGDQPYRE